MARQNTAAAAPPANPISQIPGNSYNVSNAQSNPQQIAGLSQTLPFPPIPPPVNVPSATFALQPNGTSNGVQNFASNQTNPFVAQASIVPPAGLDPAIQNQLMLIKTLSDQGLGPDRIAAVIAAMGNQGPPLVGAGGIPPPPQFAAQNQNQNAQNGFWGARPEESRDRNGFNDAVRSPPGRFRRRSRSRSPVRAWGARDSPNSRLQDDGFEYGRDSPGRNRGDDRGRGRGGRVNEYRQRSPPRRGNSPTPPRANGGGKKWVEYDPSIGKANIKGMRTIKLQTITSNILQFSVELCLLGVSRKSIFLALP